MTSRTLLNNLLRRFGYSIERFKSANYASLHQKDILDKVEVKTIFDVGANKGQTVKEYRQLFPAAMIYSFEPFDDAFEILQSKYRDDPKVKAFKLAIAEAPGSRSFNVNELSQTNSLLPASKHIGDYSNASRYATRKTLMVEATAIDRFMVEHGIETFEILKLDIQGTEFQALHGAIDHLRNKSISLIYSEVEFVEMYEKQQFFTDIDGFLENLDYKLCGFFDHRRGRGQLTAADAIWAHHSLLER